MSINQAVKGNNVLSYFLVLADKLFGQNRIEKISIIKLFFIIINYSFTLPAVKPLTRYFSKYMKIKSTGTVTITDPAIKY